MTTTHVPDDRAALVTVSAEYPRAAMNEIRRLTPRGTPEWLAPDLLRVDHESVADLARAADRGDLVFAKQLTQQVAVLGGVDVATVAAATSVAVKLLSALIPARNAGVRVLAWTPGRSDVSFGPGNLAYRVMTELEAGGVDTHSPNQEWIASIIIVDGRVHVGWNRADVALSDWPRGQIRLARPTGQASRAEFKLEELFLAFPPSIPTGRTALDLGASPGGWTRIMCSHGIRVTAVDPGDLHPVIAKDRLVTHARTTAGNFLRSSNGKFDLIVNDMRMDPVRTAEVMLDAHSRLNREGQIIVTFKLGVADPTNLLHAARQTLNERYIIRFIRQLHHNRHEVTVVATPRVERGKHAG